MKTEITNLVAATQGTDGWMAAYAAERIRVLAETAEDPRERLLAKVALANLGR
jgi:hypothetical protein